MCFSRGTTACGPTSPANGSTRCRPRRGKLIKDLDPEHPVVIEYFVSPTVPEAYVQTRLNLLSTLREFQALGGDKIKVIGHEVEPFSEEATIAEQQFGIAPCRSKAAARGTYTREEIFLGLAINCGLDKVVIPFLDRGIPVEYEMVRSIATVSQQERKKVGVLQTDAQLYARFNMQTMQPGQNQQIIDELEKQYDVVQVDPASPITEKFDVLLAVQPSSLGPEQMKNFIAAVRGGPADGDLRGSVPAAESGGSRHDGTQDAARRQQSVHAAAAAAAAQGRHHRAVEAAGRRFQRRQRRLAELQPVSQAAGAAARMGLRRPRVRRQRTVQPREPDQQRLAAGVVPVPGQRPRAEFVAAQVHAGW